MSLRDSLAQPPTLTTQGRSRDKGYPMMTTTHICAASRRRIRRNEVTAEN
jgi:hypothetical protein